MPDLSQSIGVITRGSLERGLEMKLHPHVSIEDVKAGTFLVVRGQHHDFFSMITDVTLDANNSDILLSPPEEDEHLLLRVLQGAAIFTTVKLKPMLMLEHHQSPEALQALSTHDDLLQNDSFAMNGARKNLSTQKVGEEELRPVKTVPTHFSKVYKASEDDVARIFGRESDKNSDWFNVGSPLDMDESPVCVNLKRFVQRSNGIFGKSGTGKTFLTRTVLSGLIHHQPDVVNLIFDAHNEYGWKARSEDAGEVKGLCQIFGLHKVRVYSLDAASSRTRGVGHVEEVKISLDQIEPDDILSLQDELNLADAATETAYQARNVFGEKWLSTLMELDGSGSEKLSTQEAGDGDKKEKPPSLASRMNAHEGSVAALQRKLKSRLIRNGKLLPFLTEKPVERDILKTLFHDIDRGVNIVLEFGSQQNTLVYLLIANVLTRRIHAEYVKKYEEWVGRGMKETDEPKKLMITIEEAHKFLNPRAAKQTIFGMIAREMRKYWVTLLVVDQRPSGIDDEVLSQIGTRITAQLSDEADINAVLTGVNGAAGLKGVLAQLDSKQQALVLGHSVPMPVMIQTRTYDAKLWEPMGGVDLKENPQARDKILAASDVL